jgi:hypothetical protein
MILYIVLDHDGANKGPPNIVVTLGFPILDLQYLNELFDLLWCTLIVFANAH